MSELKQSTMTLLRAMHSRREHHIARPERRHPVTGYWIMVRSRIRTMKDYLLIQRHPRTPVWAKARATRWVNSALSEARYFERRYGGAIKC